MAEGGAQRKATPCAPKLPTTTTTTTAATSVHGGGVARRCGAPPLIPGARLGGTGPLQGHVGLGACPHTATHAPDTQGTNPRLTRIRHTRVCKHPNNKGTT